MVGENNMKGNNIYLLETDSSMMYDYYDAHVVIAETEERARELCPHADEGDIWKDPEIATIKLLGRTVLDEQVVLSSFNAG